MTYFIVPLARFFMICYQKNILSVNGFVCSKAWFFVYIKQVATQYVYGGKPQWHPRLRISKTLLDIKEKWALYQI